MLWRRRGGLIRDSTNHHSNHGAKQNPKPLHREDGSNERSTGGLIGKFRHDGGGERVIAADPDAEEEAEESEAGEDAGPGSTDREGGGERAEDHEGESEAVDAAATHQVAEAAEEELAEDCASEGCGDHGGVDGGGEVAAVRVVDAREEDGDGADGEEVVGVGEEAHAGDYYGLEVVVLGLCCV
uniref:Uncharacterized protein n=1 Tax=Opuntia streptacantha TaxID=393608 RepID=A0A7C9ESB5_OPUST